MKKNPAAAAADIQLVHTSTTGQKMIVVDSSTGSLTCVIHQIGQDQGWKIQWFHVYSL